MDTTNPTHSTLDFERLKRQGFPEVVYCEGKTPQQVSENLRALAETNGRAFGTRLKADSADVVLGLLPETVYDPLGRTILLGKAPVTGSVSLGIVTAGTSDLPVASEAAATLGFLGYPVIHILDVGVAGIHRLLSRVDEIRTAGVVIVIAGMEGALPSVVGGLVAAPVIAVPTSVGYGASA